MKTTKYIIQRKPKGGFHFFDEDQTEKWSRLSDAKKDLRLFRKEAKEYRDVDEFRIVKRTEEILSV